MLAEQLTNRNRLLYELATVCAQIAQVDQFELLVKSSDNNDDIESNNSNIINENSNNNNNEMAAINNSWLSVIKVF